VLFEPDPEVDDEVVEALDDEEDNASDIGGRADPVEEELELPRASVVPQPKIADVGPVCVVSFPETARSTLLGTGGVNCGTGAGVL